jgi:hypothetical protein
VQTVVTIEHPQGALSQLQGPGHRFAEAGETDVGFGKMENEDIDIVFLEALQPLEFLYLLPLVVDQKAGIALASGPGGYLGMETLSSAYHGGEDVYRTLLQLHPDNVHDGVLGLWHHRFTGLGAVLRSQLGIEQAKEVVDLRNGGGGRLTAPLRDALFDRNRGREAGNAVEWKRSFSLLAHPHFYKQLLIFGQNTRCHLKTGSHTRIRIYCEEN